MSTKLKPIIKWVGGKSQIMTALLNDFPKKIDNYYEIFVGGGSVLINLLNEVREGRIVLTGSIHAYDINEPLISMYKNIQTRHIELYEVLEEMIKEFNDIEDKEKYYYDTRLKYNKLSHSDKNSVTGSAIFIFLNKTCFRGLFRVGPSGFNVPYGNYKKPEIINLEHLAFISELVQNVSFRCCDFGVSLGEIEDSDDNFIYLDPPYVPEKATSFVAYTKNGFNDHLVLFERIKLFTRTRFLMSNADVPLVRNNFAGYDIKDIECKRSINSKNPESKTMEVLIKNFLE